MTPITEDMLTAYADGEASPEERRAIESALEHDAQLRETLARYRALKVKIDRSFSGVLDAPVPQRIMRAVSAPYASYAVPLPPRPSKWLTPAAMAASLAVGALAGAFLMRAPAGEEGALIASAPVARALSGRDGEEGVRVVASYRGADGRVCREFEIAGETQAAAALACFAANGWTLVALEPRPPAGAYLPAGSDGKASLVSSMTAQMRPMSAEEETAFLASLKEQR